jgi:hypothetical protein
MKKMKFHFAVFFSDALPSSDIELLKKIRILLIKIILDLICKCSLDRYHYAQKLPDFATCHDNTDDRGSLFLTSFSKYCDVKSLPWWK